jgi:hypothetical protein
MLEGGGGLFYYDNLFLYSFVSCVLFALCKINQIILTSIRGIVLLGGQFYYNVFAETHIDF